VPITLPTLYAVTPKQSLLTGRIQIEAVSEQNVGQNLSVEAVEWQQHGVSHQWVREQAERKKNGSTCD
jgi:hypothetical protein